MKKVIIIGLLICAFIVNITAIKIVGNYTAEAAAAGCNILALDMNNGWDTEALDALGIEYTLVTPSEFINTELSNFDVLYVGSAFRDGGVSIPSQEALDALNTKAVDIKRFVSNGGGLVVLPEPIGSGAYTWIPGVIGSEVFHRNDVILTNPSHPVNEGLTSELLSNWTSSWHNHFSTYDSTFSVLAASSDELVLTIAGKIGKGKVVLTGQDCDYHRSSLGARILLTNIIDWVCTPSVCMADFDHDGDVDGTDLAVFASEFGRTDCPLDGVISDLKARINMLEAENATLKAKILTLEE